MKKIKVGLVGLALLTLLLPGCKGEEGVSGGSGWIGAGVARSVDKQFGPVTTGVADDPIATAAAGGGSHQAIQLQGTVSPATVVAAVQSLMTQFTPGPAVPLPGKGGIGSKLAELGSAAASVDNDPCRQDSDSDGTPDYLEDKCDPVTDPDCTGLCVDPEAKTVTCESSEASFSVKFADCQVATSTALAYATNFQPANYSISITYPFYWTTASGTVTTFYSINAAVSMGCTDTTTQDTISQLQAWNITAGSTTTNTYCTSMSGPGTMNGVAHNQMRKAACTFPTPAPCAFWNPDSSVLTTSPTFTNPVYCAYAMWIDYHSQNTLPTTSTTLTEVIRIQVLRPYSWRPQFTTTGPLDVILNGNVAIHNASADLNEQLIYTRYNNLTQVWDQDGSGSADTNPFVTLNGVNLEYTVLDPAGNPAHGTTRGGLNKGPVDGMEIDRLWVTQDLDGTDGPVWKTGRSRLNGGHDFEDGDFFFTNGSAIVSQQNEHGDGGVNVVDSDSVGFTVVFSFYEEDNFEQDQCGDPQNNSPCQVTVTVDIKARTLSVTALANCRDLDPADLPRLANLEF